jgi:two-component system response regulator HydG
MDERASLLIIDDDRDTRSFLKDWLVRRGHNVIASGSAGALDTVEDTEFDLILADVWLEWGDGIELCADLTTSMPGLPVILCARTPSLDTAVSAIRAGAIDLLAKPLDLDQLATALHRAIRRHRLNQEVKRLARRQPKRLGEIVGESEPMLQLFDLVDRVASSDASVLITGETGTGKELVATAIHRHGRRREAPFVAVDCAAMPEPLLESELFGHVRGAFTDARASHTGLLVHAQHGTVFFDEIGDMPAGLQPKLLRVLQQRVVRPVGSTQSMEVDLRVIAATNRDLDGEVRKGRFRHDLFYRLNVVHVEIPPLRERGNDVLLLAQDFVRRFAPTSEKPVRGISSPAAERLCSYYWPGNVRELRNCIERAVALTRCDHITVDDLPGRIRHHRRSGSGLHPVSGPNLPSMEQVEQRYITRVLREVNGNKALAARILGFDRKTLYRKLERYNINLPPQATA